jgi:hypothetical protein
VAAPMTKSAITDLQSEVSTKLHIYPNPVNQILYIQLDSAQPGDFYTIYNINGEKVASNHISTKLTTVDFSRYSPGIYFMKVVNGDKIYNEKVIRKQ